jgi:hypothetical protein
MLQCGKGCARGGCSFWRGRNESGIKKKYLKNNKKQKMTF